MLLHKQAEKSPDYAPILKAIRLKYEGNQDATGALEFVSEWIETELCASGPAYVSKEHLLRQHFEQLLKCEILLDPNIIQQQKKDEFQDLDGGEEEREDPTTDTDAMAAHSGGGY